MAVAEKLPELQCDHDQLLCPLQNITCQCVVVETGMFKQTIVWYLDSDFVVQFTYLGNRVVGNADYTATVEVLENGLSSNLSFPSELRTGPLTVQCEDAAFKSNTRSFSIEGLFLEVLVHTVY